MLPGYTVRRLGAVYRTPYFTFEQEGRAMTAQAFDYSSDITRKGDVCVFWASFWDGAWSEAKLIVCAEDGGDTFIQGGATWDGGEAYPYYRLYPEEVHPSIVEKVAIQERSAA